MFGVHCKIMSSFRQRQVSSSVLNGIICAGTVGRVGGGGGVMAGGTGGEVGGRRGHINSYSLQAFACVKTELLDLSGNVRC